MGISVSARHGDKATKEDKLGMLKGYLQTIALKRRVLKELGIPYEETDKYIVENFQEEIENMARLDREKLEVFNAMSTRTEIGVLIASKLSIHDFRKLFSTMETEFDEETRASMHEAINQLEIVEDLFGDEEEDGEVS